jgi:hypothetical protein
MQQFEKIEWDLYILIFNNLVQAFMQSTNYSKYLKGGQSGKGLNKNQLQLRIVTWSCDPHKLAIVVTTTWSGLSCRIPHLGREEVFGSCKTQLDLPPRLDNDSRRLNKVNFFVPTSQIPWVTIWQQ